MSRSEETILTRCQLLTTLWWQKLDRSQQKELKLDRKKAMMRSLFYLQVIMVFRQDQV